jgi:hypothetical protein
VVVRIVGMEAARPTLAAQEIDIMEAVVDMVELVKAGCIARVVRRGWVCLIRGGAGDGK